MRHRFNSAKHRCDVDQHFCRRSAMHAAASVERLAPQLVAVELDQFGSLSLVVRANFLSSGSVRGCCAWQRSHLQAASASDLP
jgi:hypothetical protein